MVPARTGTSYGQKMTAGDTYLVAGDGTSGQTGDGGPATAAEIESAGLAADGHGNLVLADERRVRVVAARIGTFYGQKMTAGDIYTVARGDNDEGLLGDGGPATGAMFDSAGLAVVPRTGNLLIADELTDRVRSVSR